MSKSTHPGPDRFWSGFAPAMAVLALLLAFLFRASFAPGMVHFSSDGPLGVLMSQSMKTPDVFTGCWSDLSWLGDNGGANRILPTYFLLALLGPFGFAKFYPPLTLLLLGAAAWVFFRTIRLAPGLCGVASIAAALNMNYFSNSCWGVGTRAMTLAAAFLALAALMNRRSGNRWLNAALAGLAVGVGVIEGADNGAIFSMFIGGFVVLQSWVEESGLANKIVSSLRLGVVVVCALLVAGPTALQLKGLGTRTRAAETAPAAAPNPGEKAAEAERNWVFATQWSLPPAEMLRVIIPGIFGYRVDAEDGGAYWGRVGEYWAIPDSPQRRASRSSGAGEYAGVLVVLVGLWGLVNAIRRVPAGARAIYDERERKYILLWALLLVPAVLFSWGYHAPFYKLVYSLPYFSTIRNPMKFMHVGHMCLMILFGYGLLGLGRRYLEPALAPGRSLGERLKQWQATALPVERWWFRGSLACVAVALLAFLVYSNARRSLTQHLQQIGFPEPTQAEAIARHSANEVGLFALFLIASVALVTLVQIGAFAGPRRRWAVIALGGLLALDLARSNTPWIKHYDYRQQYALNPVLEVLAKDPWLHRAAVFPAGMIQQQQVAQQINIANQVWRGQWLQWHAQFYNIQSIDMAQDPRPPFEKTNFIAHVSRTNHARLWELTNTRYILGLAGPFADVLNQQLDPARRSFRMVTPFAFDQTPAGYITAKTNEAGPWALIEFGGALPRAALYPRWQVSTNDEATLNTLADPAFDPHQVVLVNDPIPAPPASPATNTAPGAVTFAQYSPKHIVLKATAPAPSVLLLNDQFDRDWQVTVNGQPAPLLRCNYAMRGVQVPAGPVEVAFHFKPSLKGMTITLAAMIVGLAGCVLLCVVKPRKPEPETEPAR